MTNSNKEKASKWKLTIIVAFIAIVIATLLIYKLISVWQRSPASFQTQNFPTPPVATSPIHVKTACNPDLWQHVWNPWRLKVIEECKTVEGIIEQKFLADDGDYHLLLAPDHLVLEIICAGEIAKEAKTAQKACAGYTNNVLIPEVGDHVRITGTFVLDTNHSWNEIHPVSVIEKLP